VVEVLLWWLAFAGSHLILSSSWLRPRLIALFTLWGYRALYSLAALATFLPLCFSYAAVKGSGTLLFPALGHFPTCALMFVSVFFFWGLWSTHRQPAWSIHHYKLTVSPK